MSKLRLIDAAQMERLLFLIREVLRGIEVTVEQYNDLLEG